MSLEMAGGVLLALPLAWAVRGVLGARERARQAHIQYRDKFVDVVRSLLSDDRLNETHLMRVRWLVQKVDSHSFAFGVALLAMELAEKDIKDGKVTRQSVPLEVRDEWNELIYLWLMAVSYTRPLLGVFSVQNSLRYLILAWLHLQHVLSRSISLGIVLPYLNRSI